MAKVTELTYAFEKLNDPEQLSPPAALRSGFIALVNLPLPQILAAYAWDRPAETERGTFEKLHVVPTVGGLLLTKGKPTNPFLEEFGRQARFALGALGVDAVLPGLNPILGSALHYRIDEALDPEHRERETVMHKDLADFRLIAFAALTEVKLFEKKAFLQDAVRRVTVAYEGRDRTAYRCTFRENPAGGVSYVQNCWFDVIVMGRWSAEIRNAIRNVEAELMAPVLQQWLEQSRFRDENAVRAEDVPAMLKEANAVWAEHCRKEGLSRAAILETALGRLEPRFDRYRAKYGEPLGLSAAIAGDKKAAT